MIKPNTLCLVRKGHPQSDCYIVTAKKFVGHPPIARAMDTDFWEVDRPVPTIWIGNGKIELTGNKYPYVRVIHLIPLSDPDYARSSDSNVTNEVCSI